MGSNYSVGPFPKVTRKLANLDLVTEAKPKIYRYERTVNRVYGDNILMNRKQFQFTFEFSDTATYRIFSLFDPENREFIPALDIWGAIVLAASSTPQDKINYLFYLMDTDHDQYINKLDFDMLLRCVTRGFARLKQIEPPPMKILLNISKEVFKRNEEFLNENGEINLRELRAFLLVDDKSRTYFATLGTVLVTQDIGKLIEQRNEILKELYLIQNKIQDIDNVAIANKEKDMNYKMERGGDSKYVSLSDNTILLPKSGNTKYIVKYTTIASSYLHTFVFRYNIQY